MSSPWGLRGRNRGAGWASANSREWWKPFTDCSRPTRVAWPGAPVALQVPWVPDKTVHHGTWGWLLRSPRGHTEGSEGALGSLRAATSTCCPLQHRTCTSSHRNPPQAPLWAIPISPSFKNKEAKSQVRDLKKASISCCQQGQKPR